MTNSSYATADFIAGLDAAVKAHMDWARQVLRYVVLRESPGEDVLAPLAHTLCQFNRWFQANRVCFDELSPAKTVRLEAVHKGMHDAVRAICTEMLAGQPGPRHYVELFEQSQSELIELMAQFKTLFLTNAAQYDALTGLRLRAGIETEFVQIQKICLRNKVQLYAAMIDVDHFKSINDRYGHPVGDSALRHLADTLKRIVRPNEPLIRWGGEEFLLLLQCPGHEAAASAAERIVQLVRSSPVPRQQDDPIVMTVTLGLAKVDSDESLDSAIERADRALYAGKEAGRDRYAIASD